MGRGRQKAKQQKIARKLKYLTTDTDYDELAKELNAQESGGEPADESAVYAHTTDVGTEERTARERNARAGKVDKKNAPADDDLSEYAKWAAESASKATSGEIPVVTAASKPSKVKPRPHKPIPMPKPSMLKKPRQD
ncbi:MAG: DUF3073 domain-containing protein [Bifidobacterium sp.]|jgi:hypothetical protein|nr:DUF3073 domain-containing protein [Bifidobacterium sp.]MCI1864630.1 DUF3073 domain-containing protein [Bifidobacterium sp.]